MGNCYYAIDRSIKRACELGKLGREALEFDELLKDPSRFRWNKATLVDLVYSILCEGSFSIAAKNMAYARHVADAISKLGYDLLLVNDGMTEFFDDDCFYQDYIIVSSFYTRNNSIGKTIRGVYK